MSQQNLPRLTLISTLINDTNSGSSFDFDRTGSYIATCKNNTVIIWSLSPDGKIATVSDTLVGNSDDFVKLVTFDPTGRFLATTSRDYIPKVWSLRPDGTSSRCVATLTGHNDHVRSIAFHPTGRFLVTGSSDRTARVWGIAHDETKWNCLATLTGHRDTVWSVSFDPTGRFLATGSSDFTTKVWRVLPDGTVDQSPIATLSGHRFWVTSVVFDPTGRYLATSCQTDTKLWHMSSDDETSWNCIYTFNTGGVYNKSVAFHPHEKFFAIVQTHGTVTIWAYNHNQVVLVSSVILAYQLIHTNRDSLPDKVQSVLFHPNGNFLAGKCDDNTLKIWDCHILTDKSLRLTLLGRQGLTSFLARQLSFVPTSTDMRSNIRSQLEIIGKVDSKNTALHVALLNDPEAQDKAIEKAKEKNLLLRRDGGKRSRRKHKMIRKSYNRCSS